MSHVFSEVIGICDKGNSCNFIFVQQYLSNETSSAKKKDIHTINEIIILLGKVRPSLELSLSSNLAWIITLSMKKKLCHNQSESGKHYLIISFNFTRASNEALWMFDNKELINTLFSEPFLWLWMHS